ncbi:TetR/AcrR family transcriptional regulator [Marasmitruncus massiliensis]|uniref:TetR/AcrR family transcriptional regulator n=1 Tax=Marasmitruncus massiliensis TaxID=1944642 RepID=UPI0015E0DB3E|nr:TetR/AcrR family transcriptional regulator [Marasmitruncus massiliensis]
MPNATFFRLPEDKQKRIYDATVAEFSEYRFTDASINRIIKAAGIPRGSFYQYFNDKEDLYLYVLEQIAKEKLEILSQYQSPESKAGFIEGILTSIPDIFDWLDRCPAYNRIGLLMIQDSSDFIQNIITKMRSVSNEFIAYLEKDRSRGNIREGVDLNLVMEMYISIGITIVKEYYASGDRETCTRRVKAVFDILQNGILCREKSDEPNDS